MSLEELNSLDEQKESKVVNSRKVTGKAYIKVAFVADYAKRKANGICQACGQKAPFTTGKAVPYVECNHIEWISNGQSNTIENTVALCPIIIERCMY